MEKAPKQFIDELIKRVKIIHDTAKENMKQAQLKRKIYYDKKSKIPKFAVGDHVYLKIMKIRSGKKKKLEPKWMGPYYIVRCGSNDTYKICELQTHKLMKPLVHANRLKPYKDPRDYRPQADNHSDLRADDKTDDEDELDTPVNSKVATDQQSQKSDTSINKQRDNNYSEKKAGLTVLKIETAINVTVIKIVITINQHGDEIIKIKNRYREKDITWYYYPYLVMFQMHLNKNTNTTVIQNRFKKKRRY